MQVGNIRDRFLGRRGQQGQGLTELAIVLPVLLLILMVAIDFGRIYLGWVNLQSMARVAANYAANNASGWNAPIDTAIQQRYRNLVSNDARKINCDLPNPIPDPIFATGTDLGDSVQVAISCRFFVLTPVISTILGNDVVASASSTYPVKQGAVASVGGGSGGPVEPVPVASFLGSPTSGYAPLDVSFYDGSSGTPSSWIWDFGDGSTSLVQSPAHTYAVPGNYTVTLTASNTGGTSTSSLVAYVSVSAPPTLGAVPGFSASPRSGGAPLTTTFTDLSTGSPTTWLWNFGDGTPNSSTRNPSHTFSAPGAYTVSLTVGDGVNPSNTETRSRYVVTYCQVPNFANILLSKAQATWTAAYFTTTVSSLPPSNSKKPDYKIGYQSLPGGIVNPAGGCAALITVGP